MITVDGEAIPRDSQDGDDAGRTLRTARLETEAVQSARHPRPAVRRRHAIGSDGQRHEPKVADDAP